MKQCGFVLMFVALFGLGVWLSAHAQTASCTNSLSGANASSIPTGFGAAFNTLTATKEFLVQATSCANGIAQVKMGSGVATQYIYSRGYYWDYPSSNWIQVQLQGPNRVTDDWYSGTMTGNFAITGDPGFVIGYVCTWTGSAWKCGCRDASCTNSFWQLQSIVGGGGSSQPGQCAPASFAFDGETITAQSGSATDIRSALAQAQSGDTVVIPAGTWQLASEVDVPEGIHLKGAGKNQTILEKTFKGGRMFDVNCQNNKPFFFSDMTLKGNGRPDFDGGTFLNTDDGLMLRGKCTDVNIFNAKFTDFSRSGIAAYGYSVNANGGVLGHSTGVIHHNEFDNIYWSTGDPDPSGLGYGVMVFGDASDIVEDHEDVLGTKNALYIEDNAFSRTRHAVVSHTGSRYVFRHNTIDDHYSQHLPGARGAGGYSDWQAIDAHGPWTGPRGSKSYEIYENVMRGGIIYTTKDDISCERQRLVYIRGGDGVIFNNKMECSGQNSSNIPERPISLRQDTVGGTGDRTEDLWLWNNTYNNQPITSLYVPGSSSQFTEGVEYHFAQKPGYQPYTYPHPLQSCEGAN